MSRLHQQQLLVPPAGGGPVGVVQALHWAVMLPANGGGLTFTAVPSGAVVPGVPFTAGNRVIFTVSLFEDTTPNFSALAATVNGAAATLHAHGSNNGDHQSGAILSAIAGGGSAGISGTFSSAPYVGDGNLYMIVAAVECDDLTGVDAGSIAGAGGFGSSMAVTSGALSNASERLFMLGLTGNNALIHVTTQAGDHVVYQDPDGGNSIPSNFAYRDNTGTGGQSVVWTPDAATSWGLMVVGFAK